MGTPPPRLAPWSLVAGALLLTAWFSACSQVDDPLADYDGHRPLEILHVTQNFNPEIQWVGGRVAAVGINRGETAALDSTLVWIRTAPTNSISSVVRVDDDLDWEFVESLGGTPQGEMSDDETYTFWIAEREVLDAGLDLGAARPGTFDSVTALMDLLLIGVSNSSMGVQFRIQRDELLSGDRYLISWTPEDVQFRRMVINMGTTGRWTDHLWHVVVPMADPPSISTPVVIGETPDGAQEAAPWPEEGFLVLPPCPSGRRSYVLWAATDDWNESFLINAPGYAQFRIHFSNFPELETPRPDCE